MRKKLTTAIAAAAVLLLAAACSSAIDSGSEGPNNDSANASGPSEDADGASEGDGGADSSADESPAETTQASGSGDDEVAPSSGEPLDVSWILSKATAQADNRALEGLKTYITDNNLEWSVNVTDAAGDPAKSANLLESAVQRGTDAIILSMTDMRASQAALADAVDAGIKVFTVDSGWTEGVVVDVTSNNYAMGAIINAYMADRLGGEGAVVALKEIEHHGVRKRGKEFDVVMGENPGITVLDTHNIDNTNFFADSKNTMEDWIQRYGDQIDAVFAGWDEPGMAAADAIMEAGLGAFVVAIDGNTNALAKMRENPDYPLVATVAQSFAGMGAFIGKSISDVVIDGKDPAELYPIRTIYLDTCLITQQNLPPEGVPPVTACQSD